MEIMKIYCGKDYKEMSRIAANIISAQVILKPDCVLGLATGSTPVGTYQQLVEWYKKGDLDFSKLPGLIITTAVATLRLTNTMLLSFHCHRFTIMQ